MSRVSHRQDRRFLSLSASPAATYGWLSSFPPAQVDTASTLPGDSAPDPAKTGPGVFFAESRSDVERSPEARRAKWGQGDGVCMPIVDHTGTHPEEIKPLAKANGDAIHISKTKYGGKSKFLRRYRSMR